MILWFCDSLIAATKFLVGAPGKGKTQVGSDLPLREHEEVMLQDAPGSKESLNKHTHISRRVMEVQQPGGSSAVSLERSVEHGVVFHHPNPKQGTGISRALLWIYMGVN